MKVHIVTVEVKVTVEGAPNPEAAWGACNGNIVSVGMGWETEDGKVLVIHSAHITGVVESEPPPPRPSRW